MRKLLGLFALFLMPSFSSANIPVTDGNADHTVATTSDRGLEFQNVVVTTQSVMNGDGVSTPIGYKQATSSYMPVSVQNQPTIANTGFNVNNSPSVVPQEPNIWGATVTFNGAQPISVLYQPSVLGATVTYNGTQQVTVGTLYQPSVIGATVTFNGTQPVNIMQPNVLGATVTFNSPQPISVLYQPSVIGATVTYNGTQQVTIGTLYQPSVIGATVTFNGAQSVIPMEPNVWGTTTTLQASNNAIGSVWSTSTYVTNVTTITTAGRFLGVDNSTGVQVNTGTRFLGVDHSTGVQVNFSAPPTMIPLEPNVWGTTTTLQTSQNMIGQTAIGILNVTGSTLTWGWQNGQSSGPVTVVGFGKSGTDVTDTANTAVRVNVVAGGGAGGGTSSSFAGTFPAAGTAVGLMNSGGNMGAGRMDVSSNTYTVPQVAISSATTFPGAMPNNSSGTLMGDPYGRLVTMAGVPTSLQLSTTTDAIANTFYAVLVASPAATVFTHVCGCIITNTASTAASVDLIATGNKANGTARDYRKVFVPATDSRGIWPGCDSPFLNSIAGGVQITALSSSASASLTISCQYFQNTTP